MRSDRTTAEQLVDHPKESLSVEIKRWIDPNSPEGIEKIAKGLLALRNNNGGHFVIGFDNATLNPDNANYQNNVKSRFSVDVLQGIVGKYASEIFEIFVEYPQKDGMIFVVITVPTGVKTPVSFKSDLFSDKNHLIRKDDVYVRSLNTNNTPSTTKISGRDWKVLLDICFENREADIGRFLRRHIGDMVPELINLINMNKLDANEPKVFDRKMTDAINVTDNIFIKPVEYKTNITDEKNELFKYLVNCRERYTQLINERSLTLPNHGTWEVGLYIQGHAPKHDANLEFLQLLDASNPNYTGWPIWFNSRSSSIKEDRPFINNGCWEALIVDIGDGWSEHVDFMRLDPKGRFYLYRALQDDISGSNRAPAPLSKLDFGLAIIRTTEALAVGIAFAKALGYSVDETRLQFAFKWTGLKGRELSSWAQPERYISSGRVAYQNEYTSFTDFPLDTPLSSLNEYVAEIINPLFAIFDGFKIPENVIDDLTQRLLHRKL